MTQPLTILEVYQGLSEIQVQLAQFSRKVPLEDSYQLVIACGRLSGLCVRLVDALLLEPVWKERVEAIIDSTWRSCYAILNPPKPVVDLGPSPA